MLVISERDATSRLFQREAQHVGYFRERRNILRLYGNAFAMPNILVISERGAISCVSTEMPHQMLVLFKRDD
jgi:hypothetical protein